MEYRRLGDAGLTVSRIALGCMSFGDTSRGFSEWSLGEEDAQPFFQQALELGINFWDTANVYGFGSSEEIVGRAVKKYTRRDDIILATKVRAVLGFLARRSWNRSTRLCPAWTPTTSTCTRSTASTRTHLSRRRWRRCTTSSKPARLATSELHQCGLGSSPRCSTSPSCTAGPSSSPCKINTA